MWNLFPKNLKRNTNSILWFFPVLVFFFWKRIVEFVSLFFKETNCGIRFPFPFFILGETDCGSRFPHC